MRGWWCLGAGLLVLGVATSVDAKPRGKGTGKTKVVALFPLVEQGTPDAATVDAINSLLEKTAAQVDGLEVVGGKELKKRLKGDPGKLLEKCGNDPVCIAKLGAKIGVREVLLGRASPVPAGVRVAFLAVDVRDKTIARKLPLDFASADAVKAVLRGASVELFGEVDQGAEAGDDAEELPLTLALDEPPLVATPPPVPMDPVPTVVAATPAAAVVSAAPAARAAPAVRAAPAARAAPNVVATAPRAPPPSGERSHGLRWLGVGVGVVGAVVAGGGAYYGVQRRIIGDSIAGQTQLETLRRRDDANAAAARANPLLIGGGAAVLVGVLLISIDALRGEPAIEVTATGPGLGLGGSW